MIDITVKSLLNRKKTVRLTVLSISLCVTLLLGVERLRTNIKESFGRTVSGVDLIVGPPAGSINLLLYSVFHIGSPLNTISYDSYRRRSNGQEIDWSIPIALGDSHKGYRVVGTTNELFNHYRYGLNLAPEFSNGSEFTDLFDVVLGAAVAGELGYTTGDPVIIAHGAGQNTISQHDNLPFAVSGILAPTGTPLDRSLFVPLEGITAIHIGWETGIGSANISKEQVLQTDLTPKTINAFFLGLKKRSQTFRVQREINEAAGEPLSAILPSVALYELWSMMAVAERSLALIALFVVFIALTGMLTTEMTALTLREREMALLRSFGARPLHLFKLLFYESLLMTTAGCLFGLSLLYPLQLLLTPLLNRNGIHMPPMPPTFNELRLLLITWAGGLLIGLIPAFTAYRKSLHESLIIKT